jgi:hypothetical protein
MSEVKSKEAEIRKALKTDYPLIPMNDITTEARLIAVAWIEGYEYQGMDIPGKQKLASDIMNYARRWHDQQSRLLQKENDLLEAREVAWSQRVKQLSEEIEEKDAEIERLKKLIENAHATGWIDYPEEYESNHDMTIEKSWQKFQTDNNL